MGAVKLLRAPESLYAGPRISVHRDEARNCQGALIGQQI